MNTHLYVVQCVIDGEEFVEACVGDSELKVHIEMAERFGARLGHVKDLEYELKMFVWECCFDGLAKGWMLDQLDDA